jgi:hypothetical protein
MRVMRITPLRIWSAPKMKGRRHACETFLYPLLVTLRQFAVAVAILDAMLIECGIRSIAISAKVAAKAVVGRLGEVASVGRKCEAEGRDFSFPAALVPMAWSARRQPGECGGLAGWMRGACPPRVAVFPDKAR